MRLFARKVLNAPYYLRRFLARLVLNSLRQRHAQQQSKLRATTPAGSADQNNSSPPMLFRIFLAMYLSKRWLQQAIIGPRITTRSHHLAFTREMTTQFLIKLHHYSASREESQFWFEPYLRRRLNNAPTPADLAEQSRVSKTFAFQPVMSVVVPVYDADPTWLTRLVESVLAQSYREFEFILVDDASTKSTTKETLSALAKRDPRIQVEYLSKNVGVSAATNIGVKRARGEFIAFADHDDELLPDALFEVVKHLQPAHVDPSHPSDSDTNAHGVFDILYSDEELFPEWDCNPYPHFKPGFSPELIISYNYICHLLVMRKTLVESVGGLRSEFDGAQDHDLILRAIRKTNRVCHIPRILYRWRITTKSYSRYLDKRRKMLKRNEAHDVKNQRAVQEYIDAYAVPATAEQTHLGWIQPTFKPRDAGKVSIIIGTKNHPELIGPCVKSIEELTDYPNYEIMVVDNGNDLPAAQECLAEIARKHRVIKIDNGPEGFSFARVNNLASEQVSGEYILFLNDDTKVMRADWLSSMVGMMQFPNVGAVGARLLLPGRKLQHAGLIFGTMGWGPWHALYDAKADHDLVNGYMTFPHNAIAVTAACMLTRRETFSRLGRFNQHEYAVAFNDVDYCLRLHQAGLRCVYSPTAELMHFESKSRGWTIRPKEAANLRAHYAGLVDPYWNPSYSRDHGFIVNSRRRARFNQLERCDHASQTNQLWRDRAISKPVNRLGKPITVCLLTMDETNTLQHQHTRSDSRSRASKQVREGLPYRTSHELLAELSTVAGLHVNELKFERRMQPDSADADQLLAHLTEHRPDLLFVEGAELLHAVRIGKSLGISVIWHLPTRTLLPAPLDEQDLSQQGSSTLLPDANRPSNKNVSVTRAQTASSNTRSSISFELDDLVHFLDVQDTFALAYQVVFDDMHNLLATASGVLRDNFARMDGIPFNWPVDVSKHLHPSTALPTPPTPELLRNTRESVRQKHGIDQATVVYLAVFARDDMTGLETVRTGFAKACASSPRKIILWVMIIDRTMKPTDQPSWQELGDSAWLQVRASLDLEDLAFADVIIDHPLLTPRTRTTVLAQQIGRPIIGNRDVLCGDVIHEGANGRSFRSFSSDELADRILYFATYPEQIPVWGEHSQDWLASRSDPVWLLDQWMCLLQEAAELTTTTQPPSAKTEPATSARYQTTGERRQRTLATDSH